MKLTAELADGWLPMGYNPGTAPIYEGLARRGFGPQRPKEGRPEDPGGLPSHSDGRRQGPPCSRSSPFIGFYVGGMGAKSKNFHKEMMIRRGFPKRRNESKSCSSPGNVRRPSRRA